METTLVGTVGFSIDVGGRRRVGDCIQHYKAAVFSVGMRGTRG